MIYIVQNTNYIINNVIMFFFYKFTIYSLFFELFNSNFEPLLKSNIGNVQIIVSNYLSQLKKI
ncbi:hypothetical protein GLOIN_2v1554304, partial [Rhizophagus irregularis DAOM 181602=DAOM 197198]